MFSCGWDQRGEGNHSMFPGTDLGMKLGGLGQEHWRGMLLPSAYLLSLGSSPWVGRGLAAGVGVWDKATGWGREVRRERFVRSIGVGVSEAGKAAKGVLLMTGMWRGGEPGRSYWGQQ